jgi:hypothetical protein
MELERSNIDGIAKAGLTTGIIGTALGVLNGGGGVLGGLLGPNQMTANAMMGCGDDRLVDRYDLKQEQKIAELQTQIALRDANIYNDQKTLELYRYIDGQVNSIQAQLSAQAVQNQANKDSFQILQERLECAKKELSNEICSETNARKCADNTIVNYVNATFYPKLVADVTAGTTTTAQTLYNPLPANTCCC